MKGSRSLVLLMFFLSGATGLIFEVIWTRQLSLTLGVSVFAASAVLAAYMAGLALGSFLFGGIVDRSRNPVRIYALLEAGIGLCALAVKPALTLIEPFYVAIAPLLEDHFLLLNLTRALLAGLVVLVPATLMGGTVPAMARFLTRNREHIGWNAGLLYGVNTAGGVAGCVIAGFVLIPAAGLSAATWGTASVNLTIAAVILLTVARLPSSEVASPRSVGEVGGPNRRPHARIAMFVFALSGFAALGLEVIWSRTLVVHLHNTTYAFTVMLAVFLAGLALGNALLMRFYDRITRPLAWLGVIQVLIGISVVVAAASYGSLRGVSLGLLDVDVIGSFGGALALMSLRAALVLLPTTLLLGMTFPLVVRVVCEDLDSLSRDLGGAYAANTCGAILGSLAAAFLLIPLLGVSGALAALAGLSALLGFTCFAALSRPGLSRWGFGAAAVLVAIVPSWLISPSLLFDAFKADSWKLVHYQEGMTDTSGVYEHVTTGERFVTYGDQRGTAGTFTASVGKREGHLAHLLHPSPTRSLQIGFGVGNTLAAAALHPEVEQLDCIELSPHVRETAEYFWTNEEVLDQSKVRLIIDDGRNYLLRTRLKYDVIALDPPEIFTADVVNLYTVEFYRLVSDALTEDGLVLNWLPTYTLGELETQMLVRAVLEVFPHVSLWHQGAAIEMGNEATNMLLVIGSKKPLSIDLSRLEDRMGRSPVRESLESIKTATPGALFGHFLAGTEGLERWTRDVPAVTDDRTVVDFSTPKLEQAGFGFGVLRVFENLSVLGPSQKSHRLEMFKLFQSLREPIEPLLAGPAPADLLDSVAEERARFDGVVGP